VLLAAALTFATFVADGRAQSTPLPSPVASGDWPDPDVTRIDGAYYAVTTSGGWAPTFRILRSADLRTWSIAGSVFRRSPRWAKDSFWAPELAKLPSGGYALLYSAYPHRRRGRTWFCLGVATARSPLGPWRDLGRPLRCTPRGTIDPTPVAAGGRLYLVYKEDGNAFDRPTPILLQRLRGDGRELLGTPRELIRNRVRWEDEVAEAPSLVRRDGWWHMLYSGGLCCSPDCSYAVGSARARKLTGPWRRQTGNPILRSGNGWRCPGHTSIVGDHVAFHAYRAGDFLSGRQLLIAPIEFAGGRSTIGAVSPLSGPAGTPTTFDDTFAGPKLAPEWEWPGIRPPGILVGGGLRLRSPLRGGDRPDAGLIARRLGGDKYTATAIVRRDQLSGDAAAGLAVVRGGPFSLADQAIGVVADAGSVRIWRRARGRLSTPVALAVPAAPLIYLRIEADGLRVRLSASPDGIAWASSGVLRSPVVETARVALTGGSTRAATVRFLRATLVEH